MDESGIRLVRAAIDVGRLTPSASFAFERLGDDGFNAITAELGGGHLTSQQQVNALRALALITKEVIPFRKAEVLEQALLMATSHEQEVRSVAIHVAIWTAAMLDGLRKPVPRERMQAVVRQSMQLGLDPPVLTLAQGFLRGDGPPVEVIDVDVVPPMGYT